jgi:hypothetical protein
MQIQEASPRGADAGGDRTAEGFQLPALGLVLGITGERGHRVEEAVAGIIPFAHKANQDFEQVGLREHRPSLRGFVAQAKRGEKAPGSREPHPVPSRLLHLTDCLVEHLFGSALSNHVDKLSPLFKYLLNLEMPGVEVLFVDHSISTDSAKNVGSNLEFGLIGSESDAGFYDIAGEDFGFEQKDGPKEQVKWQSMPVSNATTYG